MEKILLKLYNIELMLDEINSTEMVDITHNKKTQKVDFSALYG